MPSDLCIRKDIEEELEFEPAVDAAGIGVSVKDGVATLTGHVTSYAEKVAAEHVASRIKGVRAIAGDIDVRLPFDVQHDDDEIARRAANILAWGVSLPATDIVQVKVEKGWVTLSGEVDRQHQKLAAEEQIRRLAGVTGLSNLIMVRPHISVGNVQERIAQAYRRNAELEPSGIHISVDGGRVTLSGKVKAVHERLTAENAAWAVPGVTMVIDNLLVM
jgi:osmotically-inducible protein OsmY